MKKQICIFSLAIIITVSVTAFAQSTIGFDSPITNNSELITKNSLKGSGMMFTPNKGQIADTKGNLHPEILYKGDGGGADVYLRKTGISYVTTNMGEVMREIEKEVELKKFDPNFSQAQVDELKRQLEEKAIIKIQRTDVDFEGGNPNPQTLNEEEVEGYTNYYYAHCPNGITNVKSYNRVVQKNIYSGIDVIYYGGKERGLKYDIVINPGADPNDIQLKYTGAKVKLDGQKLIVQSELGETVETLPKVYQNINGKIVDVGCEYKLEMVRSSKLNVRSEESQQAATSPNHYIVTFELTTYNHELPLVIDPYWATYYANNPGKFEESSDIATDRLGSVLITGNAMSVSFPVMAGGYSQAYAGGGTFTGDAYVVKFNSAGLRLWACLIGGTLGDDGQGISTDSQNNIVITGETSSANFPTLAASGYSQVLTGATNAFVVKFDAGGFRLWGCFYGGTAAERRFRIATDVVDNIIISGETFSNTLPLFTAGGYSQPFGGSQDAFVAKFSSSGVLLWATMYGGNGAEYQMDIATDKLNNIVITGTTRSLNFPVSAICQQPASGGVDDAFVVSFSSSGFRNWATFYGGTSFDYGHNIVTDNLNNIVIVGTTNSSNFPIGSVGSNVVANSTYTGNDCFLVKFNPIGNRLWATFYNSSSIIMPFVATDGSNNVYLLTEVEDAAPPPNLIDVCSYQPIFNGGSNTPVAEDQIIVKYKPNGEKVCSTYLGGTKEDDLDAGGGITIFDNSLYITAYSLGGYPVTAGAFQTVYGGGSNNTFIASICTNICEGKTLALDYTTTAQSVCTNTPIKFTPAVTNSCDTTGYKYHWIFTGGTPAVSDSVSPTVKFLGTGNYDVKLVVTTLCKKDSITKTNYITVNSCGGCTLNAQYTKGTANCSKCGCKEWIMVTGINGTPPYIYQWPDGYANRYKNGLCPGAYTINVKDKNGCSVNLNVSAP